MHIDLLPFDHISAGIGEVLGHVPYLRLEGCSVKSVKREDFLNMDQLERLSLNKLSIYSLPEDALNELPYLEVLEMVSCGIHEIYAKTFATQKKLKHLNLEYNEITVLEKDLFISNKNLEAINLRGNKITVLENDLFKSNKKLKAVDLQENSLTQINLGISLHYELKIYLTDNDCRHCIKLSKSSTEQKPQQNLPTKQTVCVFHAIEKSCQPVDIYESERILYNGQ